MSPQNVDLVRQIYSDWAKGNMRAGVEFFAPDIVFVSFMPDSREGIVAHGVEAIETFMREFLAQWRDYRLLGDQFRQVGRDTVFVRGRQSARGRQSGVAVEDQTHSIWTFRSGEVTHLTFERDLAKALEVAGLGG